MRRETRDKVIKAVLGGEEEEGSEEHRPMTCWEDAGEMSCVNASKRNIHIEKHQGKAWYNQ